MMWYGIILSIMLLSILMNAAAGAKCRLATRRCNKASAECEQRSEELLAVRDKFNKGLEIQQGMVRLWLRGMETYKSGNTEAAEHFLTELQTGYDQLREVFHGDPDPIQTA